MRGGVTYRNSGLNVKVHVTPAAQKVINKREIKGFISKLTDFIAGIGGSYAYVGKSAGALHVWINWSREETGL